MKSVKNDAGCLITDFANFADMKQFVQNYKFKDEHNDEQSNEVKNSSKGFLGGTVEECETLTSYLSPESLAKVKTAVKDELASDMHLIQDTRNRVQFHKNKHVFVAERYHAGQKRSFATRNQRKAPARVVNIMLTMGYNCDITSDEAIYNCLGGVVFAEMLMKKGYAVNIKVAKVSKMKGYDNVQCITAKEGAGYMDADTLAILASDPRCFRYWALRASACIDDMHDRKVPWGFGQSLDFAKTAKALKDSGYEFDYIFGKCFSHSETVNQVRNAIKKLNSKQVA